MIIESHNEIIDELISVLGEKSYAYTFDKLLTNEPEHIHFLIKMEVNRLTAPCFRTIDLREKTVLSCKQITVENNKHYLNGPTKKVFFESFSLYREKYTIGVYEKTIAHHELLHKRLQQTEILNRTNEQPFIISPVKLSANFNRRNENINYKLKVYIQQQKQKTKGIMAELSINAAIIRLPLKHQLDIEQTIFIVFAEVDEQFAGKELTQPIEYQIFNLKKTSTYYIARIKRITAGKKLSTSLQQLIDKCKTKSHIDFTDVYNTTLGLSLERLYLSHYPHLAVFINHIDDIYHVSHVLKSRRSNSIANYFLDSHMTSQFDGFLTHTRINRIISDPENEKHQLFFCFHHLIKDAKYFYSASLSELEEAGLIEVFLGFGATKSSWRIFQVNYNEINRPRNYKKSILPGEDEKYDDKTEACLTQLTHLIQIVDCTNTECNTYYQNWCDGSDRNQLKIYGQPHISEPKSQLVSMQFFNKIQESRYRLNTLIELSQGRTQCKSVSQDISSKGLQVTLDSYAKFNPDEPVHISFPRLQYLTKKTQLKDFPYQLVNTHNSGMTLHLMAKIGPKTHLGSDFIQKLIDANKHVIPIISENESELKNLTDGLKNLLLKHLISVPFFIEEISETGNLNSIAIPPKELPLSKQFYIPKTEPPLYNLECLFTGDDIDFEKQIWSKVQTMDARQEMSWYEVFVQMIVGNPKAKCQLVETIGDNQAQLDFINESKEVGTFIALRIYRGASIKPDLTYIEKELKYLTFYDPDKSKILKQKLRLIVAVGEIVDITQEVEMRFPDLHQNEHENSQSQNTQSH